MLGGKIMIVLGIVILAEGNTAALGIGDFAILNNPSFAPVRSYHTVLKSCGRCPRGSCLLNVEAGHSNVSATLLLREKASATHINLNIFLVGINTLEVGIDYGIALILLRIPLINREIGIPRGSINLTFKALLQGLGFI